MSKLTKYTAPIASIDSMGFPLQTERTVYLASDVDAHLATQREEIERLTVDLDAAREAEEFLRDTPWLQENATLKAERATLQAELEAMTRKRDLLKNAYDVLSTDSDELLSRNTRLEQQLAAREGQVKALEEALKPCISALRSYQYGNSATDLAKDVADHAELALAKPSA